MVSEKPVSKIIQGKPGRIFWLKLNERGFLMKSRAMIELILVGLLFFPAIAYCADSLEVIEYMETGSINWTTGIIQAMGFNVPSKKDFGKPVDRQKALNAAKEVAHHNLFEVVKSIRIDSDTTVNDFAVKKDVIMAEIKSMTKRASIVKQEYLSDGTVQVSMEMRLFGGFTQLVLPQEIKQVEPIKPVKPVEEVPPSPFGETITPDSSFEPDIYTGLIVDARGLKTMPAMSLKIYDEKGNEVYGAAFVSREFAVQQGMTGYVKDLAAVLCNPRVTDNPLTAKALRVVGSECSDIIISNAEASKVRSASEHLCFLKKCRVMIVVD